MLCAILRHQPPEADPPSDGFFLLEDVAAEMKPTGKWTAEKVKALAQSDKEDRFDVALNEDKEEFIRANWGHTFAVDLDVMFPRMEALPLEEQPQLLLFGVDSLSSLQRFGCRGASGRSDGGEKPVRLYRDWDAKALGHKPRFHYYCWVDAVGLLAEGYDMYDCPGGLVLCKQPIPPAFVRLTQRGPNAPEVPWADST